MSVSGHEENGSGSREDLESLAPGLAAGHEATFISFVDAMGPQLLVYFARRMPVHEAEECVQQVFMHVFQSIGRYRRMANGGLRAWTYKIAQRVAIGRRRKTAGEDRSAKMPEPQVAFEDPFERAESQAETERLDLPRRMLIRHVLDSLPQADQRILHLRYFADGRPQSARTYEAIALEIGMEPAAVRKRHERLRHKLIGLLDPADPRLGLRQTAAGDD